MSPQAAIQPCTRNTGIDCQRLAGLRSVSCLDDVPYAGGHEHRRAFARDAHYQLKCQVLWLRSCPVFLTLWI